MDLFVYLISTTARILITVILALMFVRMILQFFPNTEGSPIDNFVMGVTEPIIMPMRILCSKSKTLSSLPIDLSFTFTYLILAFIGLFL